MPLIKAPAKINIGLHIGPLRVDGYHNIETFMQTIDLCDELEITEADDFDFKVTGYEFPPQQENICVKAYQTLSSYVGIEKPVSMKLHKRIPISAGLGGGSSDGAAVIMELIHLWNLRLTPDEKREIGLKVGADVPFFLLAPEGTAFCSGRGEIVEPWESIWSGWVVVVFTGVEISTKWAYKMFDENLTISKKNINLKSFLKQRFPAHKGLIDVKNDFSSIVFKHHTDLQEVATALNHQGASYSSLSGSGSTVYGLFAREMEAKQAANRLAHYAFVRAVKTPAPVNQ